MNTDEGLHEYALSYRYGCDYEASFATLPDMNQVWNSFENECHVVEKFAEVLYRLCLVWSLFDKQCDSIPNRIQSLVVSLTHPKLFGDYLNVVVAKVLAVAICEDDSLAYIERTIEQSFSYEVMLEPPPCGGLDACIAVLVDSLGSDFCLLTFTH
jgi:hypothetical protein